jgi:hypothetical protein
MQEIARSRHGACLSKIYVNCHEKLKWRCAQGHEWEARPAVVKHGSWCPECAGTRKLTLEELRGNARARGGKLISENYISANSPLLWECAEEHRWETTAARILFGNWCPHCAATAPLSLEEMQAVARSRGGECLSKTYVNLGTPLKWQCAEGHVWDALPGKVKAYGNHGKGSWCPECARKPDYTLEDMRRIAASKGGKCLSTIYVNGRTPLKWRCAKGHTWEAQPQNVIPKPSNRGTWCPLCGRDRLRLTIEDMREVATALGGECVSKVYVNSTTNLRWRCAEGHEWEALPNNVKPHGIPPKGTWCPICARRRACGAASARHKAATAGVVSQK